MFFGGIRRSIPSYAQGFGELSSSHSSTAIGRGLLRRRINPRKKAVTPAEAGVQDFSNRFWIPVFTGMTTFCEFSVVQSSSSVVHRSSFYGSMRDLKFPLNQPVARILHPVLIILIRKILTEEGSPAFFSKQTPLQDGSNDEGHIVQTFLSKKIL